MRGSKKYWYQTCEDTACRKLLNVLINYKHVAVVMTSAVKPVAFLFAHEQ